MERDLRQRTKQFALRIIKLYISLPGRGVTSILGTQVLKAGTSVGAHYREAQRAKSNADFISKTEGALQELDETSYWLELLADGNIVKASRLESLRQETNELTAILVTIAKRVKAEVVIDTWLESPLNNRRAGTLQPFILPPSSFILVLPRFAVSFFPFLLRRLSLTWTGLSWRRCLNFRSRRFYFRLMYRFLSSRWRGHRVLLHLWFR